MADSNEIDALYREILGRDRDQGEKDTEEANVDKYGADWLKGNLESRRSNTPEQGEQTEYQAPSGSGGSSSSSSVMNSWAQVPDSFTNAIKDQNDLIRNAQAKEEARQAQLATEKAAQDTKRDQLYGELQTRAHQSLDINADNPIIKGQVDSYRAEQERAGRNYISDMAEAAGPLGNINGERRIAHERTGQNTAAFQSEKLGAELTSRRAEIADALNSMRGMLTTDQQTNLQRELDSLDNQISSVGQGLASAGAVGATSLGYGNLASSNQLGNRGLDLQALAQELQSRQFYDNLGLQATDRGSYWDAVRRGIL